MKPKGSITVICGSMFAGKTEELIRLARRALYAKKKVLVFKPAIDTRYDEASQVYTIRGSGSNIWFNRDEFQYAYKKIGGDFILTANFEFTGSTEGAVGHRKIGWMIRESADSRLNLSFMTSKARLERCPLAAGRRFKIFPFC